MNSEFKDDTLKAMEAFQPQMQGNMKNIDIPRTASSGKVRKIMKIVFLGKTYWVDMARKCAL